MSDVFLPKTSFSVKPNKNKEHELLEKVIQINDGTSTFLHDGPPYANGDIHIGHAYNKILKDIMVRHQNSLGKYSKLVLGWDCHGLPIEWKIEENLKKQKINKKDISIKDFRKKCSDYAQEWVDIQKEQFKSLGIQADYDNSYVTKDFENESSILENIFKLVEKNYIYNDYKPILWSPIEETSLAEAEVEYQDVKSTEMYFKCPFLFVKNTSIIIWTTTPWTLPANVAVAYNKDIKYGLYDNGTEKFILAVNQYESLNKLINIGSFIENVDIQDEFFKMVSFPVLKDNKDEIRQLYHADFVSDDKGTGFVHIAPAHGEDDFSLAKQYNLPISIVISGKGVYQQGYYQLKGKHIFKANPIVLDLLKDDYLLYSNEFTHSYPCSWRSKEKLIYFVTKQWFINLEHIKEKTIDLLYKVGFYPNYGQNKLIKMIKDRPDWCISRQRSWGVPLMFLTKNGKIVNSKELNEFLLNKINEEGCDFWFDKEYMKTIFQQYISDYDDSYEQVFDVVDVWVDSGLSHQYVNNKEVSKVYLEGSDQHRGWFQSSALLSVAIDDKLPFKNIVTHGFILDKNGKKMSKSEGNVLSPKEIQDEYGTDVLRLWVALSDGTNDIKIGKPIIEGVADISKKIRNTLKYLIGVLHDFNEDKLSLSGATELEDLILNDVYDFNEDFKLLDYDFHTFYRRLYDFCDVKLSRFYFDIRKDTIYCDSELNPIRKATLTTLTVVLSNLLKFLNPVMPFTVMEAKEHINFDISRITITARIETKIKWNDIFSLTDSVNQQLELMRNNDGVGSSLQTNIIFGKKYKNLFTLRDLEDITKTSNIVYNDSNDDITLINVSHLEKCSRCWKRKPSLNKQLCDRCNNI